MTTERKLPLTDKDEILLNMFQIDRSNEQLVEQFLQKANNVKEGLKDLMELCGDNPERDGLLDTPYRVLKAYGEYTEGYRENPKDHLEKVFDVPHKELVLVKDIEFYSMCEHHFAPFYGVAHIGYIPDEKITGLSKIARTVEGYAKRFQVQERMTMEIINAIEEVLEPAGAMVVIEAKHMCMCGRGVRNTSSSTTTSSVRGIFAKDHRAREEFLSLIK